MDSGINVAQLYARKPRRYETINALYMGGGTHINEYSDGYIIGWNYRIVTY